MRTFERVDHGVQRVGLQCFYSLLALRRQQPHLWCVDFGITLAVDYTKEIGRTRERRGLQLEAARWGVHIAHLQRDLIPRLSCALLIAPRGSR